MYTFKNVVVGLALGQRDKAKIRYAGLVSWLTSAERITLFHIVSEKNIKRFWNR